jgi:signal transduction histidine kinase
VASLLAVSNYYLEKQFQIYVVHKQDMKNAEIVDAIAGNFSGGARNLDPAFMSFMTGFGDSLARQGVTLMLYDASGLMMYCTSGDGAACAHMRTESEEEWHKGCPDFEGTFSREAFGIDRGGTEVGSVLLGYHHPFSYNEGDASFLSAFNRAFLTTSILFFAAAAAIGLVMAGMISAPIKRVTERARGIARGDYTGEHMATGTAEIDELSSSVDHLAETLNTQFMLKKRMAGAYSHEFRTPLAVLQSSIEAMIDGLWAPTKERLESLLAEIFRMSRMVSQVDDLVRVGNPEFKLEIITADLTEMASRVLRGFEAPIAAKKISLRFEGERAEASVDPDKFSQVMMNLISNAIKYTDAGGNITVKTFISDGNAVLEVSDDGIGISAADMPYIFEHLYRTDESRARDSGGNGIGLSVAKAIAEAHGGEIKAESRPGVGSRFTVTVPLAKGMSG